MNTKNLLIGLLILTTLFLMYKVDSLSHRFETFKEYQIKQLKKVKLSNTDLKFSQFKEDSYIRNQERDTTILLVFFPAFLAITAFITFRGVKIEMERNIKVMDDKYHNQNSKWETQENHLLKLESDFCLQMGHSFLNMGNDALRDKNIVYYIGYYVQACKYYCDHIKLNPASKYIDKNMIQNIIEDVSNTTKLENELVINGISDGFMKDNITSINSIVTPKYSLILAGVLNKLKIVEPETTPAG